MKKGIVFNLQHMSIHDGPGIRTTVFLKGCPLRCLWCHNPESGAALPELAYHRNRCALCGVCVSLCPEGALGATPDGIIRDIEKCKGCGKCAEVCLAKAHEIYGRELTSEDIVKEALRDRRFYEKTGGGVTFSGGEPLMQAEFTAECAEKLKGEGIYTAIETSLCVSGGALERVLPYIDYFMCDLKVMDAKLHREATGASNERILDNFRILAKSGKPTLVRVPVTVGFSANRENIEATADFLTPLGFCDVELIRMHKLAINKYDALGLKYRAEAMPIPDDDIMRELAELLRSRGFNVKVK